jgi:hypothetical protein
VSSTSPILIAVAQDAIDLDSRVSEVVAVFEVVPVAALHRRNIVLQDRQLRAELVFEVSKGARVIYVSMAIDHDLDVFGSEAEFANRFHDHRPGPGHAGIHQDVPLRRS